MEDKYDWFQDVVLDQLSQAILNELGSAGSWVAQKVEDYLAGLAAGDVLATSPLVQVVEVVDNKITLFVRGWIPLQAGKLSAFMRIEVVIENKVAQPAGPLKLKIDHWKTVVGELDLRKPGTFEAKVALGYDQGTWSGRGALYIETAGIGADLWLAGLERSGTVVGIHVDFPAAIPLGATGLGLSGLGGEYAYNFIPCLRELAPATTTWEYGQAQPSTPIATTPPAHPDARHYIQWARLTGDPDRWKKGPIDETAVGVGINATLVTMFDQGRLLRLKPIGLAVLVPGPIFLLGGMGRLLNTDKAKVDGYIAVDVASLSMALGLGVKIAIPDSGKLLDVGGSLDAFFSFSDTSLWYLNLGTEAQPIRGNLLAGTFTAELYFMSNAYRVRFGAAVRLEWSLGWWEIKLFARLGLGFAAVVGWNPVLLQAMFRLWGELGIKIWWFSFSIRAQAKVMGYLPDPCRLAFELICTIDLPWPIPDIEFEVGKDYGDRELSPPALDSPLLAGQWTANGTTKSGTLTLGAIHALTGRQWDLTKSSAWPDLEIVVPFNHQVTDKTGTVLGPAVSSTLQGGYTVAHLLTKVELFDLVGQKKIGNVQGVWVSDPCGKKTSRLHLLGQNPYDWLVPHTTGYAYNVETPAKVVEQTFGFGRPEQFNQPRRFDELIVTPAGTAELLHDFAPALTSLVLACGHFRLDFKTSQDDAIQVDSVILYVLGFDRELDKIGWPGGTPTKIAEIYGELCLYSLTLVAGNTVDHIDVLIPDGPLFIYAVRYREARQCQLNVTQKTVLKPGKYRLTVEGNSSATPPAAIPPAADLPIAKLVKWYLTQDFSVVYPETLRSYILRTTLGDGRLFQVELSTWNPTMYGFGFPAYQKYAAVVRFRVPYMCQIFDPIKMRLRYEQGQPPLELTQSVTPTPNPEKESYLPAVSQKWIANVNGTVKPDQEICFPGTFSQSGPAVLSLRIDDSQTGEVKLDEWSCYISRYDGFGAHAGWTGSQLGVAYNADGRRELPACPNLRVRIAGTVAHKRFSGNRVNEMTAVAMPYPRARRAFELPALQPSYVVPSSQPEELTIAPPDWWLPPAMAAQLSPLDASTGVRFARFALESGVRFNDSSDYRLAGLDDTVNGTTVEAVLDWLERPCALWLRTPEPLDWRRVQASLVIRHMTQTGLWPSGYANRDSLQLQVAILPSGDGSSAFLVGQFAGAYIALPRGEYEITLSFDPKTVGLTPLRPSAGTASPEVVTMKFIQPLGLDWPLPESTVKIPAREFQAYVWHLHIPPEQVQKILQGVAVVEPGGPGTAIPGKISGGEK